MFLKSLPFFYIALLLILENANTYMYSYVHFQSLFARLHCFRLVLFSFSLVERSHGQQTEKHKQKNSLFYCCEFKFDTTHAIFAHILEYFYMLTNTLQPAHTHTRAYTHTHRSHLQLILIALFVRFLSFA